MRLSYCAPLLALSLLGTSAFAAQPDAKAPLDPNAAKLAALDAALKWKQGTISLPGGKAVLNVPPAFRYLDPAQADLVLTKIWNNPPGPKTLGMLFPAEVGPYHDDGWGVVITYQDDGHISDEDAEKIDYDDMLKDMQKASVADNAERKKQGYEEVQIVRWATRPRYDKDEKKMYWAEELKFEGAPENTLNYKIRVLGREGVLVLNCIAGISQLKMIEGKAPNILAMTDFTDGNKYAEYNPSTDRLASYGIGALVAGSVAAKTGLFKGIFAILLASKKLLALLFFGGIALVAKLFGGGSEKKKQSA